MKAAETAAILLRLSAFVHEEDGLWVAGCPSLDVFSQGDSEEDAKSCLQEAVELWIDSCLERNKLAEALRELGWYLPAYQAALISADRSSIPPPSV